MMPERFGFPMIHYELLLFDLDGTLADTAEGVLNSVVHTLRAYGIAVAD